MSSAANLAGRLLEVAPGRFLGVTAGLENPAFGEFGSIFEVTADGGFATLHRFSNVDVRRHSRH